VTRLARKKSDPAGSPGRSPNHADPAGKSADHASPVGKSPERTGLRLDWTEVALYAATAIASLLILVLVLRLDLSDLRVPLYPAGDAAFYQGVIIRPLITQPWYIVNPELGAPHGFVLFDFPVGTDSLLILIMKFLAVVTRDSAVSLNLFYYLTYPLTVVTTLWAARSLGLRRSTSAAVALLFAYIPYHLIRAEAHLTLAAYFMLPIALIIALRPGHPTSKSDWRPLLTSRRFLWRCLASLAIGLTGVYYAFFYVIMLAVVAVRRAAVRRDWRMLVTPAILAAIVGVTVYAANLPTVIYQAANGKNDEAVTRSASDSEWYALRPIQLVLPILGHRVGHLNADADAYQKFLAALNPVLDNETRTASLGMIGVVGLVLLFVWLVVGPREPRAGPVAWRRMSDLASINIVFLLLGTVGGLGFMIAWWVTPILRGYNRVSVAIGMLALLVVGAALDRFWDSRPKLPKWLPWLVVVCLVAFGVWDQTTPQLIPDHAAAKVANTSDRAFAAAAQKALPTGSSVFQLPFVTFPGSDPTNQLPASYGVYDMLVPYEYSFGLKWSFPAMRGRPDADWQRSVAQLPVPQMLSTLQQAGFSAVYVDRDGYSDNGAAMEASLTAALGAPVARSSDDRRLLWRMTGP
jgi:phosphoglycerol transferase